MSIAKISMLGWVTTYAREGILKEKSYQQKKKKEKKKKKNILICRLLLVVTSGQKSNLTYRFKWVPITTYYLWFVVKVLWKCYEHSISHNRIYKIF